MTDQERLLTAIYVEAQETNKLLHLVSEQLGAVFAEAGKLRDKYDPEEFYVKAPEEYFNR
jgi:hypothetical protein